MARFQAMTPQLLRLRRLYPAVATVKDTWVEVKVLVRAGKEAKAETLCKDTVNSSTKMMVRNKIAVRHRILRAEFLQHVLDSSRQTENLFRILSDKITTMLSNNADRDGTIARGKMNRLLDMAKVYNSICYSEYRKMLVGAIRGAIWYGMTVTMKSAQDGLDYAKKLNTRESFIPPGIEYGHFPSFYLELAMLDMEMKMMEADKTAEIPRTSTVFQTIFAKVNRCRIATGLFKGRNREQSGQPLSRRIWDMRNGNEQRIRRRIAQGIGSGESATSMASDIKKMTWKAEQGVDVAPGGPGVYKTAYKNALRVTRTEIGQAYVDAEVEYAIYKGYKKVWNVTAGHPPCEDCEALDGKVFDAEDVPDFPHPNCLLVGQNITMADGTEKVIEKINVGDFVIGCSGKPCEVTYLHKNWWEGIIYEVEFSNGKKLLITGNHPIFVVGKNDWIDVENLRESDKVFSNKFSMIRSNGNNIPPMFDKIFSFFNILKSFLKRIVPASTVYFNSDHQKWKGNIDVKTFHIVTVKSTKTFRYSGFVYNLTVEKDESYFAESILCHNCVCYLTTVIPGIS